MSADVTFFVSVSYFSTHVPVIISETVSLSLFMSLSTPIDTDSLPVPAAETTDPHASKPVQDFRYVYIFRPKVPVSEPVSPNHSPVDGPSPPSAFPLILIFLLSSEKVNVLALITLFLISFLMII